MYEVVKWWKKSDLFIKIYMQTRIIYNFLISPGSWEVFWKPLCSIKVSFFTWITVYFCLVLLKILQILLSLSYHISRTIGQMSNFCLKKCVLYFYRNLFFVFSTFFICAKYAYHIVIIICLITFFSINLLN